MSNASTITEWPTLATIRGLAARHFGKASDALAGDTRVDALAPDELALIAFLDEMEMRLQCDLPNYEAAATATLAQLAALAEAHKDQS